MRMGERDAAVESHTTPHLVVGRLTREANHFFLLISLSSKRRVMSAKKRAKAHLCRHRCGIRALGVLRTRTAPTGAKILAPSVGRIRHAFPAPKKIPSTCSTAKRESSGQT